MKKVYAIVLYYDKEATKVCREINILFENEEYAIMAAHHVCLEKKLFFKLKEYIL